MFIGRKTACHKEAHSSVCKFRAIPIKVSVFLHGSSDYLQFYKEEQDRENAGLLY